MKQTMLVSKPISRIWHNLLFSASLLAKPLGVASLMLAVSICATTSAFSQTVYVSVSPDPAVCAGDPIFIKLNGVGDCHYAEATVQRGQVVIVTTSLEDANWSGQYTTRPQDAGTLLITASDGCGDNITPASVTVVELDDVELLLGPTNSGWTQIYYTPLENFVALKSAVSTDVVLYNAVVTPFTATAGTLINWSGATAASDHLTATIPANSKKGPTPVYAYTSCCTTLAITNWIFWGSISYNMSTNVDADDALRFNVGTAFDLPDPDKAGAFCATNETMYNSLNELYYAGIWTKVEIIGTLSPSGIGDVIGANVFTFNTQQKQGNKFEDSTVTPVTGGETIRQQTTPVHDKIFAQDAPAVGLTDGDGGTHTVAQAVNFEDLIYIGSVPASDEGDWHAFEYINMQGGSLVSYPFWDVAEGSKTPCPISLSDPNW